MSNATKPRPPVNRSLKVLTPIQADGTGVIRITAGKVVEEYAVQTFPAYDGAATGVTLTKTDGTTYNLCLAPTADDTTCDCPGFTYHRQSKFCKHLAALGVLTARGELPLPIPETAEEETDWLAVYELAGC
jgi:hypothetical protein